MATVVSQTKVNVSELELDDESVAVSLITYVPSVSASTVVSSAVAVPKVIVPEPDTFSHK